jgi:glycine cleavage system H protein
MNLERSAEKEKGTVDIPENCRYTKEHEWIRGDDGDYHVGITAYAADQLGDITYIELPEPGKKVKQGAECATVESVKAASDIYAPVDGIVGEVNEALNDTPELVNSSPYGDGWFFRLDDVKDTQVAALMDAAAYEAYLATLE